GAQRDSASDPKDLVPNQTYSLDIEMHLATWTFPKGHRIRLAVSNAMWPMIWPTPYKGTTSLWLGGANTARLELPMVPLDPPARPHFTAPEKEAPLAGVKSEGDTWPPQYWTLTHDLITGNARVDWVGDDSSEYPWGKMKDHEQMGYEVLDSS